MAKRKRKNAPGAGRPVGSTTTGSTATPKIEYRVSRDERAELDHAAGATPTNEFAKRAALEVARRLRSLEGAG